MKAHLETQYEKGFLLTEENLIKLSDIIAKRLSEAQIAEHLQFKIFRVDGALLEMDKHSQVTAEENSTRNAIMRLELSVTSPDFSFRLVFDPKEMIELSIEAENKDFGYLIFSDVKEYISSEVLAFRSFSFEEVLSGRNMLFFVALGMPLLMLTILIDTPEQSKIDALIASSDVNQKMNYLIQRSVQKQLDGSVKYLMAAMIAVVLFPLFIGTGLDKAFPRNIFCWGKAAISYDRFLKKREKIIWSIVIAFIIGVASTIAVDYFKDPSHQNTTVQSNVSGQEVNPAARGR